MSDKKMLPRRKSHAFGKDVYLFAESVNGVKYWLEEPSWDCGWYWGFGYLEAYTRNGDPENSFDKKEHLHFSGFVGTQERYDNDKRCYVLGEYIHNVFDNPELAKFTFDSKVGWKISELFEQFYLLKRMAAFSGRKTPGCNVCDCSDVVHGDLSEWSTKINEELIPRVTAKIISYLTPEE